MTRNAQDIIDDFRNIVKPRLAEMLLEANYEGCGKEDKAEFETEFETILTLAEKALTQEPKWILVSERLPEEKDYCLCCDKDGNITIGFISKYSKKWVFDDDEVDMDVTAWMPLPKPYKAEMEEKNVGED